MNKEKINNNIINDIKIFEKEYLINNKDDIKDFQNYILYHYKWLEKEEYLDLYLNIYNNLKKIKNRKIDKKTEILIIHLKLLKINFKIFNCLDNENELLIAFITVLVTKNLISYSFIPKTENDDIFEKYKPMFQTIDDLVNIISDQFNKFIIWLEILYKKEINWIEKDSRCYFHIALYSLINDNIISKQNIWFKNKTYTFVHLVNKYTELNYQLEIYYIPFNIYKKNDNMFFQYNIHFSSIIKILKENPKSGKNFYWSNLEIFLKKQTEQSWLYLHTERIDETIELLSKEYKINKESIEIDYNDLIKIIKKSIEIRDIKSISELSKKIPLYQTIRRLLELRNISNNKQKIYIPFFKDFRGRKYDLSTLTLTFFKELRYVTYRGYYENNEKYLDHNLLIIVTQILDKYIYLIDSWSWLDFSNFDIKIKRELLWILIAAGEHKKAELGDEINIKTFIEEGKKEIENFQKNNLDIETKLKISYLIFILKDIHKKSSIKWLIPKDATASGIQHLVKTVGIADEEVLKWCNLKSTDTWYDTYAIIINKFLNNIEYTNINEKELKEIFNRKTLKRTIMTENYGAGIKTCFIYFKEKVNFKKYNSDQIKEITKIFNLFYKKLSDNAGLLKYSPSEIKKFILRQNNYQIELNDGSIINHIYFKQKKKQTEYRYNEIRISKQELSNTNENDLKKMDHAMIANYIQTLDAILIRWYLYHNWAVTIHDCFMIDYRNTSFLIAKLNEGMSLIFHDLELDIQLDTSKLFSIFILL